MKINVVTPAGRKESLEILYLNLKKQRPSFDNWTLWVNTSHQEDIDYCCHLANTNDWIQCIPLDIPCGGSWTIYSFFKHCIDKDTVYIRLDDDIVWLEKHFIAKLANFRINNPEYFLVYGNTINNAVMDHIHQRKGALADLPYIGYSCVDPIGWANGVEAEKKHRGFMNDILIEDFEKYKFNKWILSLFERVSINCISWLGSEFEKFQGLVGVDEEQWLSHDYPKYLNKPNAIFGESLCAHYGFYTQRPALQATDILKKYREIANRD